MHMMKNTHASIRKTSLPASMLLYVSFSSAAMDINLPAWSIHMLENSASLRGSAIIDQSLWVTGTKSTVFVSQDGGKTWKDKSPILPTERDFRDIELFDKNTAIIMSVGNGADSVLYKTENGGDTWNTLYENKDEAGFFDSIAFWDNDNGLLLGDPVDGFYVVKKTTVCITSGKTGNDISFNAGKSWQSLDASDKQDITGFYTLAASDMVFLAAGADGKIGVVSFKPE